MQTLPNSNKSIWRTESGIQIIARQHGADGQPVVILEVPDYTVSLDAGSMADLLKALCAAELAAFVKSIWRTESGIQIIARQHGADGQPVVILEVPDYTVSLDAGSMADLLKALCAAGLAAFVKVS